MTDPKQRTLTFSWGLGENRVASEEAVQPVGEGAALTRVENIRLRSSGELPEKQPFVGLTASHTALCGGFAPLGQGESTVQFLPPSTPLKTFVGTNSGTLFGHLGSAQRGLVGSVVRAYSSPGDVSLVPAAVCKYDGKTFSAVARATDATSTTYGMFITVVDDDGGILVPTQRAYTYSTGSINSIVGLTAHSTRGVYLWTLDAGTGTLRRMSVTVSGVTLTVGAADNIYTPGTTSSNVKVCTDGSDYAWFITHQTGSTAQAVFGQVDMATGAVGVVAPASFNALSSASSLAISAVQIGATKYVAIGASNAGNTNFALYNGLTQAQLWAQNSAVIGAPSCAFDIQASGSSVLCGISIVSGAFSSGTQTETRVEYRSLAAGTLSSTAIIPWHTILGAANWKRSDTEVYGLFLTQHRYGTTTDPTSLDFEFDPSVEVYVATLGLFLPAARLGVDTARRIMTSRNSSPMWVSEDKLLVSYVEDVAAFTNRYPVRIAEVSFGAASKSVVPTAQGPAVVAGALALSWDGTEVAELCPLHQPACRAINSGGSGPALTAGAYSFRAVYKWRDAAGQIHRSAPSAPSNTIAGGAAAQVIVTVPVGYKTTGLISDVEIEVYATLNNQAIYYYQNYIPTAKDSYVWTFGTINTPLTGLLNPVLYTTGAPGQELPPLCPPAFSGVAAVNSRLWGIDAEHSGRAWPSKIKQDGKAFEFHPDLCVTLPAAAGKLLAVASGGGYPLFFAERGVWAIAGSGPNNSALGGQPFSEPMRVSSLPCASATSVVETPVGVMFATGDRFAVASAQGAQVLPAANSEGEITCAYVDEEHQEVVWLFADGHALVYSYALQSWRTWAAQANDSAALVPATNALLMANSTSVYRMASDSVSVTAQGLWQTGWILLGGEPQADCQLQDIILQCKRSASHGVTMTVYKDFETSALPAFTWTAADITAISSDRYTLCASPKDMTCRAVKILLQETGATGTAMQPLFCTLVYGQKPAPLRQAVKRQGRK